MADENCKPEFLATAWFIKTISRWFSLMTSRNCNKALGLKDKNIYNNSITFLYEIIDLFNKIKIDHKETFKPVQRGIILSTTSIINLVEYLLQDRNFKFVLTGRLTQDCMKNLFSVICSKNVIPNCLQFKNNLKLIAISMFMRPIVAGNYDYDENEDEYSSNFLEYLSISDKKDNVSADISLTPNALATITNEIPPFNNNTQIDDDASFF